MTSEQKIVQYLNEAHAVEAALVQTLTAHIAMTPEGPYRDLLGRHLDETREQAERILGRLSDLGESRNPIELIYGIAQTAIGQLVAAGKFPLDLLRGSGGEEKLLKNARDEAASEALEIATYDSLEALATVVGDEETAVLAREHRAQEEAFLADLREMIPELTRAVHAAEVDGDPSYELSSTGAAQAAEHAADRVQAAAREAAADVQRTAGRAGEAAEETVEDAAERVSRRARESAQRATAGAGADTDADTDAGDADAAEEDLPIEGYADLAAAQVLPKLRLLSQADLARVEAFERGHRSRKQVLARIEKLRASTDGQPVGTR